MTARATDPLWADEQHERATSWRSDLRRTPYPGPQPKPVVRLPDFDEADNCTRDGCGHPKSEHGKYGCKHAPSPRSMAFCFCPTKVWS